MDEACMRARRAQSHPPPVGFGSGGPLWATAHTSRGGDHARPACADMAARTDGHRMHSGCWWGVCDYDSSSDRVEGEIIDGVLSHVQRKVRKYACDHHHA
jgi:hypothetical protein